MLNKASSLESGVLILEQIEWKTEFSSLCAGTDFGKHLHYVFIASALRLNDTLHRSSPWSFLKKAHIKSVIKIVRIPPALDTSNSKIQISRHLLTILDSNQSQTHIIQLIR
jgi:hypothetical protein